MATSRRTGTNENISTFGDGTRDFTVLATWEATVDVDTTAAGTATTEVLECYDDLSPYDAQLDTCGGAHDTTYPLIIRAAPGHECRMSKVDGVHFTYSGSAPYWRIARGPVFIHDLGFTSTVAQTVSNSIRIRDDNVIISNCHIYDIVNAGGNGTAILIDVNTDGVIIVNCLFNNIEDDAINVQNTGDNVLVLNCTIVGGSEDGLDNTDIQTIAINTGVLSMAGDDFTGTYAAGTTTNASEDGSAPGTSSVTGVPRFLSPTNFRLSPADQVYGKAGTDLSAHATFPFDDDIDGNLREVPWSIGAHHQGPLLAGGGFLMKRRRRLIQHKGN